MNKVQSKAYELYSKFYVLIWGNVSFDDDREVSKAAKEATVIHLTELLNELGIDNCQAGGSDNFDKINFYVSVRLELESERYKDNPNERINAIHKRYDNKRPLCPKCGKECSVSGGLVNEPRTLSYACWKCDVHIEETEYGI